MVAPPFQGNDIQQVARLFELLPSRIAYPSSCRGADGTNRRIGLSRLQKHLIVDHAKAGAEIRFTVAHIVSFRLLGRG